MTTQKLIDMQTRTNSEKRTIKEKSGKTMFPIHSIKNVLNLRIVIKIQLRG